MRPDGVLGVARHREGVQAVFPHRLGQVRVEGNQQRVVGPLDDRAVKILVGQRHLVDVVFLDRAAEGILDLLQVGELLLLHVDRREPHRHLLDGQAHLHDVGDLVVVLLEPHLRSHGVFPVGDERALAVSDFDEPHRLQDAQRLPHGRTPDVEQLAQLHFGGELVPLAVCPGQDAVPDVVDRVVGGRDSGDRLHRRAPFGRADTPSAPIISARGRKINRSAAGRLRPSEICAILVPDNQ